MNLFLTGTDTDVGKTFVASLLIRAARARGVDCVGMKPICCGGREDAEALHAASGGAATLNDINPVWLRAPAAPYAAALVENRAVDLDLIRDRFAALRGAHDALVVEGAGGWCVPITREFFMGDLAAEFGLPVAVVVANRLSALNHTLLTVEAIRRRGLTCAGVILNHPHRLGTEPDVATATTRVVIEAILEVPVLWEVSHGEPFLPSSDRATL